MGADQPGGEPARPGLNRLRAWARALRLDVIVVWRAARDRRTPWGVRLLALAVAAYALSPVDLIPDAIPVLGYLDDLILVPAGLWLCLRLIPREIAAEHRAAAEGQADRPVSRAGAALVITLWLLATGLGGLAVLHALS